MWGKRPIFSFSNKELMIPIKLLYRICSLGAALLAAVAVRAAGPGVVNLLPSDYRAANKNWAVAEDDTGTLYVGNDMGLLEFDGQQWRLYELPRASIVRSVAPSSHDVIFTGGFEEFGRWDRDASGSLRYTSLVPAERSPRFADSDFWKIHITPQGVLFQSFHGIYLYDFEKVRRLSGEMNMLFLLRAGDEFWVQEMGGPLYRMRQERFEPLPDSERFSTTTVRVLLPGPHAGEWIVGTGTQGLWRYDGERFVPWGGELSARLRRDELNCGILTSRGTYLFGTLFGGLCEADAEGRLLGTLSTENQLLNNSVMALAEDAERHVWVALDRGLSLLMYYDGVEYHTYNRWTAGSVYDACRWQGKLLLATNQGVFAADESRLAGGAAPSDFHPVAGLSGQAWSFDQFDGRLFVSHNTGVTELLPDFTPVRRCDMGGYRLQRVKLGERERTYFASYYKLRFLDDDGTMREVDGLDEPVYRIEADYMRNLWLEHPSKGVYRCRMSADGRRIAERTLYGGGAGDGLPYKLHLLQAGGRVLLSGGDRFFRYNEYADRIEADTLLDAAFRGVEDIRRVIPLDEEEFWVVAGRGVWKLRYDGHRRAELTPCAGIPVDNMIYGYEQVARLDDSTCLFCGDDGFELVDPHAVASPPLPSVPLLVSLRASGRRGDDAWFSAAEEAEIPHSRNSVTFRYRARGGALPDVRFRHRLVGMDDAWSAPERAGTAVYARLPQGRYTFEVAVCDSFGRWSDPARFAFAILTPWYATPWAYAGYVVLLGTAFYGLWLLVMRFYRRRYLRRLRLQEIVSLRRANKRLQQQVASRDAEIAAQSTALIGRNEMILRMRDMVNDFQAHHGSRTTAPLWQKINAYVSGKFDTESDWTQFLMKFERKHSSFFRIMRERFPELTPSDLRLSACLKMNLCTKEIASLMNLSVRAVENSRYRLRKKLGLTSAQNLNGFLMHIDSQESVPEDDETRNCYF